METQTLPLDALQYLDRNPRRHSAIQVDEMVRSLQMFGQYRPIVTDGDLVVLAGNGLLMAMHRLEWETAEVLVMHDLTPNQRMKLVLADNKLGDMSGDDYSIVDAILRELDGDLDIPGYDESVLAEILSSPEELTLHAGEYGVLTPEAIEEARRRGQGIGEANEGARTGDPGPTLNTAGLVPVTTLDGAHVCPTCGQSWG